MKIIQFDDQGNRIGEIEAEKVTKPDQEWQQQLDPLSYQVARNHGTERAFTGPLYTNHAEGLYRCVCCGAALFDSSAKYESGSGWPSFYTPLAEENILSIEDRTLGMKRVENRCAQCDAHLGHVFPDGPAPTGLRYCMNSASLKFIPRK